MDRASTFADEAVITKLQREFIPVAANSGDVQWGNSPGAKWFMGVARQLNERARSNQSTQGFYTASAAGKAFGFSNVRDAKVVKDLLTTAAHAYHKEPQARVDFSKSDLNAYFARSPQASTSVLRVFTRIRPLPLGAHRFNQYVGRDFMWILDSELKEIATKDANGSFSLPSSLAGRIARFHLVDNVRGEPDLWQPNEVRELSIRIRRTARKGIERRYTFNGSYTLKTADNKRGERGTLEGELIVDTERWLATRFRAFSEGEAWGEGRFTPLAPAGRFPIVRAFVEATDLVAREVAPAAMAKGADYLAAPCGIVKK